MEDRTVTITNNLEKHIKIEYLSTQAPTILPSYADTESPLEKTNTTNQISHKIFYFIMNNETYTTKPLLENKILFTLPKKMEIQLDPDTCKITVQRIDNKIRLSQAK
jgi:hypothetical protein